MDSQRSKRNAKKLTRFQESTPSVPSDSEVAQKVVKRQEQKAPLRLIAVEILPEPTFLEFKLPDYQPPLEYTKKGGHSLISGLTQLQLFYNFFRLILWR